MKLSSKSSKGWHYESLRHGLSARGLKTGHKTTEAPLIVSTDAETLRTQALKPLKHSKPGKTKYHKDVYKGIKERTVDIDAMTFHKEETRGRPIILIDESLPKTKFGKLYRRYTKKGEYPTKSEAELHELLHLKHPHLKEQQIRMLTGKEAKKKFRWWER